VRSSGRNRLLTETLSTVAAAAAGVCPELSVSAGYFADEQYLVSSSPTTQKSLPSGSAMIA
jgi:hypothetical protein